MALPRPFALRGDGDAADRTPVVILLTRSSWSAEEKGEVRSEPREGRRMSPPNRWLHCHLTRDGNGSEILNSNDCQQKA